MLYKWSLLREHSLSDTRHNKAKSEFVFFYIYAGHWSIMMTYVLYKFNEHNVQPNMSSSAQSELFPY